MGATAEEPDVVAVLRRNGHRVTRARLAVWDALSRTGGHQTAEEVAEQVPDTDLASVYRSLALFDDLGLVRQSRLTPADAALWELAHPDEHFHVVCDVCGSVDHHVGSLVAQIRQHLSSGHGFTADRVDLHVSGRCARCADEDM